MHRQGDGADDRPPRGDLYFLFPLPWDRRIGNSGQNLFNWNGTVPFGEPFSEGDALYGQIMYRRDTTGD